MTSSLILKDSGHIINVTELPPPYESIISFSNGDEKSYIVSLDNTSTPIVTERYEELPTIAGSLFFTSDRQLVEINSNNDLVENIKVTNTKWSLIGPLPQISFITFDDQVLDFEAFDGDLDSITEGTTLTITFSNFSPESFIFSPSLVASYTPISETEITFS